jgi:predicted  nucleic acid-binding Zn-ribbon protein
MNELINNIWKLQSLEFDEAAPGRSDQIAELRAKIPLQIPGHYDRLRARGKKGVAIVRNQVCTACHMQVPLGAVMTLMRGMDIQLCECCGRYLYLPGPAATPNPPAPKRSPKKTNERETHLPPA